MTLKTDPAEHDAPPRHTTVAVDRGDDVEIDLDPCGCAPGVVCLAGDPFAALCPRRPAEAAYLVMRGGHDAARYVRKLLGDIGAVSWTEERAEAHRFAGRDTAVWVQQCIVARDGGAVAVVPAEMRAS